jgi:holo-[acyl-carrier protein] synthase
LIPPSFGAYVLFEQEVRAMSLFPTSAKAPISGAATMILGIGTDLLEVARMEKELTKEGGGFRDAVFTPSEIAYCEGKRYPARHFAARFAAKEALVKALPAPGVAPRLRDVEVERTEAGAPHLVLHGRILEAADRLGVKKILVSLSHTDRLATASVVLEG